jgi:hypothetical protein
LDDLAVDGTLEDTSDVAKTLATEEAPAIGKMAAVSMLRRLDAGPLALWLADAVLATASDGRDADRRPDSAQPTTTTDRSSRLFERLVAISAARGLTGRSTYRLYGI